MGVSWYHIVCIPHVGDWVNPVCRTVNAFARNLLYFIQMAIVIVKVVGDSRAFLKFLLK